MYSSTGHNLGREAGSLINEMSMDLPSDRLSLGVVTLALEAGP